MGATVKVNAQAMTKDTVGVYYYDWQSSVDDDEGDYDIKVILVHSAKTSIKVDPRSLYLKI